MLEITDQAASRLQTYLGERGITSPVRVTVVGGCGGPRLSLFLDEARGSDHAVETAAGLRLIIDQELLAHCGAVTVDYLEGDGCGCRSGGFAITAANSLPGAEEKGAACTTGGCRC
ncbi:MAG: IscA/HesB family protein [Thermodesulfobacteriota bacterium]